LQHEELETMTKFASRRIRNASVTLVALAVLWLCVRSQERNLGSTSFTTGYILLAAIVFLAMYNVRKKLPFLPLGSSTAWLQWHLYVGLGSMGLFALHVGATWPNGVLEIALALIYLLAMTLFTNGFRHCDMQFASRRATWCSNPW
jgi:membrane associated rhomboid family serine protease